MGWLNGLSGEVSNAIYFAPQFGVNALLGQFNAYVVLIVDEAGNPIEGATVTMTNQVDSETHSTITDANGEALAEPFVVWSTVGNSVVESGYLATTVEVVATGFVTQSIQYTPLGNGFYRTIVMVAKAGMMGQQKNVNFIESLPEEATNDTCYCAIECAYRERVFTDGVGTDYWKNDISTFLQRKLVPTDSITFELWKNGVKLTDIVSSAFGDYYSTFAAQPLYTGLQLEWLKVWQSYGFGNYQIRVSRTILGVSDVVISRVFDLKPYSDSAANNTVVIESYQTGNILASDFDYTGLVSGGWLQRWRVAGTFGDKTPTITTDRLEDSERNSLQIQDKITNEYTLDIRSVTGEIFNAITQDGVLGNSLLITDFRILAPEFFRRTSVSPVSFESTTDNQNRRIRTIIKFTDSRQNIIKRNF